MQYVLKFEEELLMKEVSAWEHSESDKGQIYTRPEVVEFMLTAIGLNSEEELTSARILEPSCGEGEFVVAIVERILSRMKKKPTVQQLMGRILAVDLVTNSLEVAKCKVGNLLSDNGYDRDDISTILDNWFVSTDFLLEDIEPTFTHVVGNPPYVRVESIPKSLLEEYRRRFYTMTDRADLYIPFFEKSLSLLQPKGKLSFICTDRWTKNTYGKSLRKLISDQYSLELFIDLYGIEAFERDVMTYPAITQIVKGKCTHTALKHETTFSHEEATEIVEALAGKENTIQMRQGILCGENPWLLGCSDQIALVNSLEDKLPKLEETGCKVFIGAATGSNKVYIVDEDVAKFQLEDSRTLPVITANEIKQGYINWRGKYLVNTYDESGVVDLANYPKLSSYLNDHKQELCKRHVAKKDSLKWFRTIDRVYAERARMEKLLIPDISNDPVVIYDKGEYHPNNSIYYISSDDWNLHALRVVLLSNVTKIFISTYSTKIAKGYMRFQAQYLRKLRIPHWNSIDESLQNRLIEAGKGADMAPFTALACEMYGLNEKEKSIVEV